MAPSRQLNPHARAWEPAALKPAPAPVEQPCLMDLPEEVTSAIISCLGAPADLVACGLVCKPFLSQVASAELSLDLSGCKPQHMQLSSPSLGTAVQMVASLPKYMPGVVRLDLSGLALEDKDVAALLAALPRLKHLELANCRKVTTQLVAGLGGGPAAAAAAAKAAAARLLGDGAEADEVAAGWAATHRAAAGSAAGGAGTKQGRGDAGVGSSLRALNLQRCFQLRDSALTHLLASSAQGALPLNTLALSHLDLAQWPWPTHTPVPVPAENAGVLAVPGARQNNGFVDGFCGGFEVALGKALDLPCADACAKPGHRPGRVVRLLPTTGLTMLALNNCTSVGVASIAALATLCPRLQFLMLGGCSLTPGVNTGGPQLAAVSGMMLPDTMLQRLPELTTLLAHATSGDSHVAGCGADGQTGPGTADGAGRADGGRGAPAADVPWMLDVATCMAAALLSLAELRAVEVTFLPAPVVWRVAAALKRVQGAGPGGGVQVWDLTKAPCVQQALAALSAAAADSEAASSNSGCSSGASSSSSGWGSGDMGGLAARPQPGAEAGLRLALRCAANCSNLARVAPAHVAAERGDAGALKGLLALGAGLDSKERAGAAPLFLAAEAGHLTCVATLLEAGANPQLSNSAGERPLYIASLRGHLSVVKLLLEHCSAKDIPWQDAHLYSDCWTPLMAAAVADRHDVALALMQAAGMAGGAAAGAGTSGAGPASLVRAVNRYGQSVLHIAARKASARLLRLLLSCAGAGAATYSARGHDTTGGGTGEGGGLMRPDSNGDTPLDVARKHCNHPAYEELMRRMHGGRQQQHPHAQHRAQVVVK